MEGNTHINIMLPHFIIKEKGRRYREAPLKYKRFVYVFQHGVKCTPQTQHFQEDEIKRERNTFLTSLYSEVLLQKPSPPPKN